MAIQERDACPECQSDDFEDSYPEIPDFSDDPLLAVIYTAEQHIPRAENGAILVRDMLVWLRFHGVRERSELLQWESWFNAIGNFRGRVQEELMALPSKSDGEQEDRED